MKPLFSIGSLFLVFASLFWLGSVGVFPSQNGLWHVKYEKRVTYVDGILANQEERVAPKAYWEFKDRGLGLLSEDLEAEAFQWHYNYWTQKLTVKTNKEQVPYEVFDISDDRQIWVGEYTISIYGIETRVVIEREVEKAS